MFKINDKVVCVNAKHLGGDSDYEYPRGDIEEGAVYCVEGIVMHVFSSGRIPAVFLCGKPRIERNPEIIGCGTNIPWAAHRFRLVSEVQAENRAKRKEKKPA